MPFHFGYYVGQAKSIDYGKTTPDVWTSLFLPSGCYIQNKGHSKSDLEMVEKHKDNHILGKNHIEELNAKIKPLCGFRLLNERGLIATLEDGTKVKAYLNESNCVIIEKV